MADEVLSQRPHRSTVRLRRYDYASAGAYFVTICTRNRACLFGDVTDGKMMLTKPGQIAEDCLLATPSHFPQTALDSYVVTPNHVHVIIVLNATVGARHALPLQTPRAFGKPPAKALSSIVGAYKSAVTKRINDLHNIEGQTVWQRNYYEHIIRNDHDLARVREYIDNNPTRWTDDENHPDRL